MWSPWEISQDAFLVSKNKKRKQHFRNYQSGWWLSYVLSFEKWPT